MKQTTSRARRFRIESLEPRNLLAFGAGEPVLDLPSGVQSNVAETSETAQPHTLLSREAFLERGFRGVDSSDARPAWSLSFHNNPERWYQAAGVGSQSFVVAPASYNTGLAQGRAIVMLRALQTHEPLFVVAIRDFDEHMIIHSAGDRLEEPITISSPGSQPLPLFGESGSEIEPEGEAEPPIGESELAGNDDSAAGVATPTEADFADAEANIDQAIVELSKVLSELPDFTTQGFANDADGLGIDFGAGFQRPDRDQSQAGLLFANADNASDSTATRDLESIDREGLVLPHDVDDQYGYSSRWLMQYLDPSDLLSNAAQTDMLSLEDIETWGSVLPGAFYLKQIFVGAETSEEALEADTRGTSPLTILAASGIAVMTAATISDRRRSQLLSIGDKRSK